MPKTLPERIFFTIVMAAIMVYGMIVYNVALNTGGVTNATFVMALHEMPIMVPIACVLEFFVVILLSSLYTCTANTGRLLFSSGTRHAFRRWLGAPALAALLAAGAGACLKELLADGLRSELPMQLAALGAGGCTTAAAFLLAAWPLGLGEEVKALRTKSRQPAAGRTRAG